ncbi:MAG: 8-oxo-dGTP pyrophosphatase MutT (NUDIX family) [Saprospiraceae bacterium]|jgi:8-oxo-dGTP pyrophosphatase MutT (NUDIX family)
MYKIYINDTPLFLVNPEQLHDKSLNFGQKLVARYNGKPKFLFHYIDMLEKTDRYDAVIIFYHKEKKLFADFKSLYKRIDAAGGIVYNDNKEILMIYRRQSWDLPKGKIDPGESKKAAAIREVQEETGITDVKIVKRQTKTLHTYRLENGNRVLKYSFWYLMKTSEQVLTPQAEEDIEEAVWIRPGDFIASKKKAYGSIMDVLLNLETT